MTLKAANIQEKTGLIIIAIQDKADRFFYNPPGTKKLQAVLKSLNFHNNAIKETMRSLRESCQAANERIRED